MRITAQNQRRRPSARTAMFAVGAIGLAAGLTATMSAWTDEAEITGDISTGTLNLLVDGAESATFTAANLVPGESAGGTFELSNASTVPASVVLDVTGLDGLVPDDWNLSITSAGDFGPQPVYDGDPTELGDTLNLGQGGTGLLVLDPEGTREIVIALTLDADASDESQAIEDLAPVFTFTATQSDTDIED